MKVSPSEFDEAVQMQAHLHGDLSDAPPLTLAFDVAQELRRRSWSKAVDAKMSGQMHIKVMAEAKWAAALDDSPRACAVFAVDMAVNWAMRPLGFDTAPKACFVRGHARRSVFNALKNAWEWPVGEAGAPDADDEVFDPDADTDAEEQATPPVRPRVETVENMDDAHKPDSTDPMPLALRDLARVRRLVPDLDAIKATGTLLASWSPRHKNSIYTCDMTRPPVEALAVVRAVVGSVAPTKPTLRLTDTPAALCIGCGWGGAAQALSALLPQHWVYHQPWPYHEIGLPPLAWQVVVLNVPSRLHWRAARVAARPGEIPPHIRQRVLREIPTPSGGRHVEQLVREALLNAKAKTLIALMADYRTHQQAVGLLRTRSGKSLASVHLNGIDTGQDPIWVAYHKQPWTPHGLPRPTGRVVSFWRAAP